jgi:hypothetical protein
LLPDLRPGAALLLPFGILPAAHQLEARRIPAIPLVRTPRLEDATATLPRTTSWLEARASGRSRELEVMLRASHGRLVPLGPPERLG